jgi:glycosyltransferase involved in cell wall biosynthesis
MVREMAVGIATRFANSCDAVIAPSTDIQKQLVDRGVDVPIRVIPTGVDLGRFEQGDHGCLRQKLGLASKDKIVLFVSRLAKEKNVSFLLDAFTLVSSRIPDAHFVLVGSGDEEQALKEQAASAGNAERVHFMGTLGGEELISAYKAADLFVFASVTETQGMVVLEAMAGGCPVVAVDAPGVRDVVQDQLNGYLVAEGDVANFAEHCVKVLDDDELRRKFREAALARAQQLSLSSTTSKVEQLYEDVIQEPHPDRNERFLLVKELIRYYINRMSENLPLGSASTE